MFLTDAPTLDLLMRIIALGPLGLLLVVLATRIVGLRSFSKMTAFDFVSTVAIGSLLAGAATVSKWPAFFQNVGGIFALLAVQAVLAAMRRESEAAQNAMANDPVLLMKDSQWHLDALHKTRVSKSDVWAKLREANVCDLSRIRAVVLEATGDISVLHADALNDILLHGVHIIGDTVAPVEGS